MLRQVNTFSLWHAAFTLGLACLHLALCQAGHALWTAVAGVSTFWFFLVLPALIIWNVGLILYHVRLRAPFERTRLLYFAITLPAFLVFSNALSSGCLGFA